MFTIRRFAFSVCVLAAISLVEAGSVSAGWETGAKVGFDTNVSSQLAVFARRTDEIRRFAAQRFKVP